MVVCDDYDSSALLRSGRKAVAANRVPKCLDNYRVRIRSSRNFSGAKDPDQSPLRNLKVGLLFPVRELYVRRVSFHRSIESVMLRFI
jgi:hypothetical protein